MKFVFEDACVNMLTGLGARPIEHHRAQFEIDTIAGRLVCTPFDTWLACRFDDVSLAKIKVGSGTLNPFNAKWNWHFSRPDADAVEEIRYRIWGLLP